jgi:hypothetical protein
MRSMDGRLLLAGAALLLAAGCATSEEWATWKQNPAHFASLDHYRFSMTNRVDTTPHVTRDDVEKARAQNWWGRPVTVRQEQILER